MKKRSKRYKKLIREEKTTISNDFEKLIPLVKKTSTAKFDESIDLNLQINLKQRRGRPRSCLLKSLSTDVQSIMGKTLEASYLEELKRTARDRKHWMEVFTHSASVIQDS